MLHGHSDITVAVLPEVAVDVDDTRSAADLAVATRELLARAQAELRGAGATGSADSST